MVQNRTSSKDLWVAPAGSRAGEPDPEVADLDKRSLWCQAFFYGGNTLRLWNEATELKMALLTACSLKGGQNIFVVGKYADESGITRALSSLIGQEGKMSLEEIGPKAVTAFRKIHTTTGKGLQWDFNYFNSLPDGSLDRVVLFGSASHVANWKDCAQQIHRVLRSGGRVVIAEAPWGGKELLTGAHMDTHLEGILAKILSGMQIEEKDLPDVGPEELADIFKPFLGWSRAFSWRGLYLFYGQKDVKAETPSFDFPVSTEAVQAFLTEKPVKTAWDFLSSAEVDILGQETKDVEKQKKWVSAIGWGGGFGRQDEYSSIFKPLWKNLKAEPDYKVLIIGEFLERMWIPELKKRMGETGEIAAYDINAIHHVALDKIRKGIDVPMDERHQWDYPYADTYPDNYFDLIWLPQGSHHANSWKAIAPRLVRALKPGGQIIMQENRTGNPEFFTGLKISGLMQCIADKIWWGQNLSLYELPDYSVPELVASFGDSLTDTYVLDWKGWLLFWGFKK